VIVLDTNVLSELMRPAPAQQVIDWFDRMPASQAFITSVTVAELLCGVAKMPPGQRKAAMSTEVAATLNEDFCGRALAFTYEAAVEYADIVSSRERQGLPISIPDAQIAAICRLHGADIATRNVKDFAETGVRVIDPWAG
jgi:hypothetical protein